MSSKTTKNSLTFHTSKVTITNKNKLRRKIMTNKIKQNVLFLYYNAAIVSSDLKTEITIFMKHSFPSFF
jgi:hypothetical protein